MPCIRNELYEIVERPGCVSPCTPTRPGCDPAHTLAAAPNPPIPHGYPYVLLCKLACPSATQWSTYIPHYNPCYIRRGPGLGEACSYLVALRSVFIISNFKLSVSNPKNKHVAYVSVLSRISNCQGLGRKNKLEILKTYRTCLKLLV